MRPTPDRVRETLFNWLAPVIEGARCLDLFAGSGALGFEAASRGADSVLMIEQQPSVANHLRQTVAELGAADNIHVLSADALVWMRQTPSVTPTFDVVFLDPPYQADLLSAVCVALESSARLSAKAWVYLESPIDTEVTLPRTWTEFRSQTAGQVRYHLLKIP